jgi:hypothetical protein
MFFGNSVNVARFDKQKFEIFEKLTTIILEDDEKSLNVTPELLNYFSDCSGLRANFDKTEAFFLKIISPKFCLI